MREWYNLTTLARSVYSGLLDLIYPPKCIICDTFQPHYLCPDCIAKIDLLDDNVCGKCGAPVDQAPCKECRGRDLYFDSACSAAVYGGVMREAIHFLKYSGYSVLVPELGKVMADACKNRRLSFRVHHSDIIIPIPTDAARLRERGFSQSDLLAAHLASAFGKKMIPNALIRTRKAPAQSSLSYEERLINLIGAFSVTQPQLVTGKKILLIDDIYTTGSTTNEAAKVLKEAGAVEVHVFTLARSL